MTKEITVEEAKAALRKHEAIQNKGINDLIDKYPFMSSEYEDYKNFFRELQAVKGKDNETKT